MEINKLPQFIVLLIAVGMLVGVGIISLDKTGDAAKERTVVINESFLVPVQDGIVNLSNGNLTVLSYILNATGDGWPASNYSTDLISGSINNTGDTGGCSAGDTCYVYYTYNNYATKTKTVTSASSSAIGEVSTSWMSLIVTIGILALIIGLVILGFYYTGRR